MRSHGPLAAVAIVLTACGGGFGSPAIGGPPDARDRDALGGPVGDGGEVVDPDRVASWESGDGLLPEQACAPWTLVDDAVPEEPVLVADGLTLATDANGDDIYYQQEGAALSASARWTITARVRVDRSSSRFVNRSAAAIGVEMADINRAVYLFIGDDVLFLGGAAGVAGTRGATLVAPTTDRQHTYGLEIERAGRVVSVYRDGELVLVSTAIPNGTITTSRIYWGELSAYANGSSQWESFSHDGHAPIVPCL